MEYYIDRKNDARKYIIKNNRCFYTGKVGVKKDTCFLKFVLTACYKINEKNIKKCSFDNFKNIIDNDLSKSFISEVDYKKLYKR